MTEALKKLRDPELIDLQRLAHLLRSLNRAELETLELLLDDEARTVIKTSLQELDEGKGIPLDEW